jgi:hypothetical protein
MRMPDTRTAWRRLVNTNGLYLSARLSAHPETKLMAATWTKVNAALKTANDAVDAAWEKRVMSRAALDFADLTLDNAVRQIAAAAKADMGGTTNKPDYKKLFRRLPSEIVAMPLADEIAEVKSMETELLAGKTWKAAKDYLSTLRTAREGLDKAVADYKTTREAYTNARDGAEDVELDWMRGYRGIYGALTEKFAADRQLVESFFWREQTNDDAEPATTEPTTPTPAQQ